MSMFRCTYFAFHKVMPMTKQKIKMIAHNLIPLKTGLIT